MGMATAGDVFSTLQQQTDLLNQSVNKWKTKAGEIHDTTDLNELEARIKAVHQAISELTSKGDLDAKQTKQCVRSSVAISQAVTQVNRVCVIDISANFIKKWFMENIWARFFYQNNWVELKEPIANPSSVAKEVQTTCFAKLSKLFNEQNVKYTFTEKDITIIRPGKAPEGIDPVFERIEAAFEKARAPVISVPPPIQKPETMSPTQYLETMIVSQDKIETTNKLVKRYSLAVQPYHVEKDEKGGWIREKKTAYFLCVGGKRAPIDIDKQTVTIDGETMQWKDLEKKNWKSINDVYSQVTRLHEEETTQVNKLGFISHFGGYAPENKWTCELKEDLQEGFYLFLQTLPQRFHAYPIKYSQESGGITLQVGGKSIQLWPNFNAATLKQSVAEQLSTKPENLILTQKEFDAAQTTEGAKREKAVKDVYTFVPKLDSEGEFGVKIAELKELAEGAFTICEITKEKFDVVYRQNNKTQAKEVTISGEGQYIFDKRTYSTMETLFTEGLKLNKNTRISPQELTTICDARRTFMDEIENQRKLYRPYKDDQERVDALRELDKSKAPWYIAKQQVLERPSEQPSSVLKGIVGKLMQPFAATEIRKWDYCIRQPGTGDITLELALDGKKLKIRAGNATYDNPVALLKARDKTTSLPEVEAEMIKQQLQNARPSDGYGKSFFTEVKDDQGLQVKIKDLETSSKNMECLFGALVFNQENEKYFWLLGKEGAVTQTEIELMPSGEDLFNIGEEGLFLEFSEYLGSTIEKEKRQIYAHDPDGVKAAATAIAAKRKEEISKEAQEASEKLAQFVVKADSQQTLLKQLQKVESKLKEGEKLFGVYKESDGPYIIVRVQKEHEPTFKKVSLAQGFQLFSRSSDKTGWKSQPDPMPFAEFLTLLESGVSLEKVASRPEPVVVEKPQEKPKEELPPAPQPAAKPAVELPKAPTGEIPARPDWLDEKFTPGSAADNFARLASNFTMLKTEGWPYSLVRGLSVSEKGVKGTQGAPENKARFAANKEEIISRHIPSLPIEEQFWLYELASGKTVFTDGEKGFRKAVSDVLKGVLTKSLENPANKEKLNNYFRENSAHYPEGSSLRTSLGM